LSKGFLRAKKAPVTPQTASYELKNPRLLLQAELTRRISRNPRYSMRRFAQALGISHTVLSLVLSGKRPLSKKAASQVSDVLGLNPMQREKLIKHRKKVPHGTAELATDSSIEASDYRQISLDTFTVVSDWYHFAILSLLELPTAKLEPKWISSKLGISEIEAKLAVERLLRLDLIRKNPKGEWKQAGHPIRIGNEHSTSATRKFHAQLLAKALESLEHDPFETRDFTSMTLIMDSSELPYAREKIRDFRRKLTQELEARGKPDRVYNLNVQIFPLSKTTPLEES
jgi:uncharacterized protein (TIGR02147 family)